MAIELLLQPHLKDLGGGFVVRRSLPAAQRQSVGPFVFFDHFGPVVLPADSNTDVRPHPHIGLATVTYLFEGAMMHRDSLGFVQRIEPGAINWMTAGRGVVHSERTPEDLRGLPRASHGLQLWAALPADSVEVEPSFSHTPAADIPEWHDQGVHCRVLIGSSRGLRSPVKTFSETLYLDLALQPGGEMLIEAEVEERAVYGVDHALLIDGERVEPFQLAVLEAGKAVRIHATDGARLAVIGGAPLEARRFIWWNFVATSRERIELAKEDWRLQRMGAVPGETDYIPLP